MAVIIEVNHQPSGGKEWVAAITGLHPKYTFERTFLPPYKRNWSRSGRTGKTFYKLEDGFVYEINEPYRGRRFVKVISGKVVEIDKEEALAIIEAEWLEATKEGDEQ